MQKVIFIDFRFFIQILWDLANQLIELKISIDAEEEKLGKDEKLEKVDPTILDQPDDLKEESDDLPSTINWSCLPIEGRKTQHSRLHAQLRAMINTACLPSQEKVSYLNTKYHEMFLTYVSFFLIVLSGCI